MGPHPLLIWDGWMGGWMDGWMNEWMDGWVGGWMDGWMIDEWMEGRTVLPMVKYRPMKCSVV